MIELNKKRSTSVVVGIVAVVCLIVVAVVVHSGSFQRTQYPPAYKFSLIDLEGEEFSLADYEGKVVILNFMSICDVCREQIGELDKVYDAYPGRVEIVSISLYAGEGSREQLYSLANSCNAEWKFAVDTHGTSVEYQVNRIPTTIIVDQDGFIRFTHVGLTSTATITSEVEALLNEG